jgi:hypothetical protein
MPSPSLLQRLKERKLVQWGSERESKGSLREGAVCRTIQSYSTWAGSAHLALA